MNSVNNSDSVDRFKRDLDAHMSSRDRFEWDLSRCMSTICIFPLSYVLNLHLRSLSGVCSNLILVMLGSRATQPSLLSFAEFIIVGYFPQMELIHKVIQT